MYNYLSAIISLPQCTYFAQSTGFAQMNVSFTDRLTKNDRQKGVLNRKSCVKVK